MALSDFEIVNHVAVSNLLQIDPASPALKELKRTTNFQAPFFLPISQEADSAFLRFFTEFVEDLRLIIKSGFGDNLEKISSFLKLPFLYDSLFAPHFDLNSQQIISRPDFFWSRNGFQMIEQNISSAVGGISQVSKMLKFMSGLPSIQRGLRDEKFVVRNPMAELVDEFAIRGIKSLYALDVEVIRGAYWDDTFLQFSKAFERRGIVLNELFPELIRLQGGQAFCGPERIDHVLRLAVVSNVVDRRNEFESLLRSSAEWHGNLNEIVLWNKLWLPFFSDSNLRAQYGINLKRDYSKWIPWSRLVKEDVTEFEGRLVSLIDLLLKEKDRFVVKKGNGWLTKAVFFGSLFSRSEWLEFIQSAIAEGDWMVQEFLEGTPVEMDVEDSRVQFNLIVSPYILSDRIAGYMVRTPGQHLHPGGGFFNGLTTAFVYRGRSDLL